MRKNKRDKKIQKMRKEIERDRYWDREKNIERQRQKVKNMRFREYTLPANDYKNQTRVEAACMAKRAILQSAMEQHTLKNVNNCLNTNIYPYLETSGGQSSNLY